MRRGYIGARLDVRFIGRMTLTDNSGQGAPTEAQQKQAHESQRKRGYLRTKQAMSVKHRKGVCKLPRAPWE